MQRIINTAKKSRTAKRNRPKVYEPTTPSAVESPTSTVEETENEQFQVLSFSGREWVLSDIDIAPSLPSFLDSLQPLPHDPTEQNIARRTDVHKLSKRRQIPVMTTLGLIHVRFTEVNIANLPVSDIRTSSILSYLVYHVPESQQLTPFPEKLNPQMSRGFPISVEPANPTDPQATLWLFSLSRQLFISFRGNHDLDHVYQNLGLSIRRTYQEDVRVIPGFVSDFKRLDKFIRPIIDANISQIDRIVCTGHGLGAAVATVAAPFYGELLQLPVDCITFGSPRVGNKDFVEWFNINVNQSLRVVATNDPLQYLPTRKLEHVTDSICITKNGYTERWPRTLDASSNVSVGIGKINFDSFRWENNADKYRKRVIAAIVRANRGLTKKVYTKIDDHGHL